LLIRSTRDIIFLGTPHGEASIARWAKIASRSVGPVKQKKFGNHVLKDDCEALARIQDDFHTMAKGHGAENRLSIEMACFYEGLPLEKESVVSQAKRGSFPILTPMY
jgi:hypothetical protein